MRGFVVFGNRLKCQLLQNLGNFLGNLKNLTDKVFLYSIGCVNCSMPVLAPSNSLSRHNSGNQTRSDAGFFMPVTQWFYFANHFQADQSSPPE